MQKEVGGVGKGRRPSSHGHGPYALRIDSSPCRQFAHSRQSPAAVGSAPQAASCASTPPAHLSVILSRSFCSAFASFCAVELSEGAPTPAGVRLPKHSSCAAPLSVPLFTLSRQPCIALV